LHRLGILLALRLVLRLRLRITLGLSEADRRRQPSFELGLPGFGLLELGRPGLELFETSLGIPHRQLGRFSLAVFVELGALQL
jgi:hypothetical protein